MGKLNYYKMEKYTDSTLMPFGKHKGKRLIDVPAHYLIWLLEFNEPLRNQQLKEYIEDNLEALKKEVKDASK